MIRKITHVKNVKRSTGGNKQQQNVKEPTKVFSNTEYKKHRNKQYLDELPVKKIIDYFLLGPFLGIICVITLPSTLLATLAWIILCTCCKKRDATYISFQSRNICQQPKPTTRYTFMTANMLLGPDFIGNLQNMPHVHKRLIGSASSLSMLTTKPAILNCKILESSELDTKEKRNSVIIDNWPENIDFVCLQEVWDRMSAMVLLYKMCGVSKLRIKSMQV